MSNSREFVSGTGFPS